MFKQFKTFRVVYETKNFSKAAELLFISQPAVSTQIKHLEEELQIELFIRNGRKEVVPTKQAQILYQYLLNLSDDWEEVKQALHKENMTRETCRIVASNTFAVYYLPDLMSQLIQQFPEITFVLDMNNSEEVLDRIEKHQAHFGFIEKPLITEKIVRKEIQTDELVRAGDFSQSLWLVREENSGVFHYTERFFLANNLNPQKMVIKNNEMIIKCLERGIGQSIISKRALPEKLNWQPLGPEYQRKFYFIKRQHIESVQLSKIEEYIYRYFLE